jgi:hypothetical protein
MSFVLWTSKSLTHLVEALSARGHQIKKSALAEILHDLGFSLRANKKMIEGTSHPNRGAQFGHINSQCQQFEKQGDPIISVDCKKKELIGTFKNNGAEWQAKGAQTCLHSIIGVNCHLPQKGTSPVRLVCEKTGASFSQRCLISR